MACALAALSDDVLEGAATDAAEEDDMPVDSESEKLQVQLEARWQKKKRHYPLIPISQVQHADRLATQLLCQTAKDRRGVPVVDWQDSTVTGRRHDKGSLGAALAHGPGAPLSICPAFGTRVFFALLHVDVQ